MHIIVFFVKLADWRILMIHKSTNTHSLSRHINSGIIIIMHLQCNNTLRIIVPQSIHYLKRNDDF